MTSPTSPTDPQPAEETTREPWEDDYHRIAVLITQYARACEAVTEAIYGHGSRDDLAAAQAVREPLLPELLSEVADLAVRAHRDAP